MMLFQLLPILVCPQCRQGRLLVVDKNAVELYCDTCATHFPVVHGRPVLLRNDNELFCVDDYLHLELPNPVVKKNHWRKLIAEPSLNLASKRVLAHLSQILTRLPAAMVLVVGGGCQRKWLNERLDAGNNISVVYSDIDSSADVDLFCDGHDLPFAVGTFDAVITTAVLEHVLYPERVAAEITRVLKVGGLLYSELPFMQQVHEGAYDFTRYSLSGHRRLFNNISEIESGIVAGPGTALVWAIENFSIAFIVRPQMRKITKAVVRLIFGWIKYFDILLESKPAAMDGASCTYLLGSKISGHVSDADIITRYVGAQDLRHT